MSYHGSLPPRLRPQYLVVKLFYYGSIIYGVVHTTIPFIHSQNKLLDLSGLLLLFSIKSLGWLGILLTPLVRCWFLFSHIISYFSTFVHHYVDVPAIFSSFCRDTMCVLIVLILFLLYLPQQCCAILYVMICCVTIHACCRW